MRKVLLTMLLVVPLQITVAQAFDDGNKASPHVVVTPLASTKVTADGQPIILPQKNAQLLVSTYDIPAGATLPVHKHPFPRYAYVLAGTLQVTYIDTGKSEVFKAGDFIVEVMGPWHQGTNIGPTPIKLLVIDQVEEGAQNTVLR